LALGRTFAINLGIDHRRVVTQILLLVSVLIAVSTALVGPILFFGLLVAAVVLERLFAFDTALAIVIEFLGGLVFIALVLKQSAR